MHARTHARSHARTRRGRGGGHEIARTEMRDAPQQLRAAIINRFYATGLLMVLALLGSRSLLVARVCRSVCACACVCFARTINQNKLNFTIRNTLIYTATHTHILCMRDRGHTQTHKRTHWSTGVRRNSNVRPGARVTAHYLMCTLSRIHFRSITK